MRNNDFAVEVERVKNITFKIERYIKENQIKGND